MTLPEKIVAVQEVFDQLEKEVADFKSATGLHCAPGCGKCCFKPDIEATVLEFLPFAHYLYKEKKAREWLKRLKTNLSPVCMILEPGRSGAGLCSSYAHRGLICRLFGYSARRDKLSRPQLVTCRVIKTEQKEQYEAAVAQIDKGLAVPVMTNYYMRLYGIDMDLSRELYPINTAIRKAIEAVLTYYSYRLRRSA